ncbi:glycine betaine ABC transporter substrate-binding protein [Pseudomonas sp. MPC6]|uniref:glycine betaine ABC transporter substrate-binding protein n=1 Tax=unclassified Pseudomonas TaxID=196821 RepID=UPI001110B8FB|nr:glycine betaine ABC transporter substrate-binding protein [Pseudomonas sp. MPC6]QCY09516.1 hypothetical protein ELQ88_01380 [Pseudomonas sp. MPC6]
MVKLDMAPYDEANDSCNAEADCKKPTLSAFPVVAVNTVVADTIKNSAPVIYQFLRRVQFENAKLNKLLAWGEDNKVEPKEVAQYFLKNHQNIWKTWVPQEVADKVITRLE